VCIRGCSDFVSCIDFVLLYYCLNLYDCISPYRLQWVLVISVLSTSLSACVVIILLTWLVSLTCIIELYYWFVSLHCIIVLLHYSPQSTVSIGLFLFSTPTCLLVFVLFLQEGRLPLYYNLLFAYCLLSLTLLVTCLLPYLLRAVAPALTLITSSKLRPTFCLLCWTLMFCWLIVGW